MPSFSIFIAVRDIGDVCGTGGGIDICDGSYTKEPLTFAMIIPVTPVSCVPSVTGVIAATCFSSFFEAMYSSFPCFLIFMLYAIISE